MGMYLDVTVVYGVAWSADEAPSAAYPEYPEGHEYAGEQVDDGESVFDGRLVWGSHGMTCGSQPERHLAVCQAPSATSSGRYAALVPDTSLIQEDRWDAMIRRYCEEIGLDLGDRKPGWLALASFG